jgi:hypothetical protein
LIIHLHQAVAVGHDRWEVGRDLASQLEILRLEQVVTIAGHPRDDLPAGTWRSILRQAGLTDRRLD